MAKYIIETTNRFLKQAKLCLKRGFDMNLLEDAVDILREKGELPARYKPHKLAGNYKGYWECHLRPDWLLVWKVEEDRVIITLTHTGTHSDLFD